MHDNPEIIERCEHVPSIKGTADHRFCDGIVVNSVQRLLGNEHSLSSATKMAERRRTWILPRFSL
jgi:hypothetical protein